MEVAFLQKSKFFIYKGLGTLRQKRKRDSSYRYFAMWTRPFYKI